MISHKKEFAKGIFLAISFFVVLAIIYSPVFNGKNGLEFADEIFNKMAKGSTYFIPDVMHKCEKFMGKSLDVSIIMESAGQSEKASKLFYNAGCAVIVKGSELKISGDLGKILQSALTDSDNMFNNKGDKVFEKYGYNQKEAMYNWWVSFKGVKKGLNKQKRFEDAKFVSDVVKKAVEPGYNFYGIEPKKVRDYAGILTGSLIFYVLYTMWWGFAIYFLFEGLGLKMEKAKVKKEV